MLATTGPAGGIGSDPLLLEAIIGGLLIVALSYAIAAVIAARRGALGTGRASGSLMPPTIKARAVRRRRRHTNQC